MDAGIPEPVRQLVPSLVVNYMHANAAFQQTFEAIDEALAVYAQALEDGVERLLVGCPSQPVYRRYKSYARTDRSAAHGSEPVTWAAAKELRAEARSRCG